MSDRERGMTLIELVVTVSIVGLIVCCAVPSWLSMRRRNAVRSAAAEMRVVFRHIRSRAIARSTNAGIRFARSGTTWTYTVYDDGDGDGVRSDDVASGVDRRVSGPSMLWQQTQLVNVGLPRFVRFDPDGEQIRPGDSPVQFNRSAICSFSRLGQSTPGTIYLTDDSESAYAVRVYGATGKLRLMRYDQRRARWEER